MAPVTCSGRTTTTTTNFIELENQLRIRGTLASKSRVHQKNWRDVRLSSTTGSANFLRSYCVKVTLHFQETSEVDIMLGDSSVNCHHSVDQQSLPFLAASQHLQTTIEKKYLCKLTIFDSTDTLLLREVFSSRERVQIFSLKTRLIRMPCRRLLFPSLHGEGKEIEGICTQA